MNYSFDDLQNGDYEINTSDSPMVIPEDYDNNTNKIPLVRLTNACITVRGKTYSGLPYSVFVAYDRKKNVDTQFVMGYMTAEFKIKYDQEFADAIKQYMPEAWNDFFCCTLCNTDLTQSELIDQVRNQDCMVCAECKNK